MKSQLYQCVPNLQDVSRLAPDQQAQAFLSWLAQGDNSREVFQTFNEKNTATKSGRTVSGTYFDQRSNLRSLNSDGNGVFVTVNQTDGKGRKAENITSVRAYVADFDDANQGTLQMLSDLPVPPSCIIESSPRKYHAYWGAAECPCEKYKPIQKALAAKLGSDPAVCDLSRVMRVAGFYHQKTDTPFLTRIVSIDHSAKQLTPEEFISALGLTVGEVTPALTPVALPTAPRYAEGESGTKYGLAALTGAVAEVEQAGEGSRNNTLNSQGYQMGQLVAGGELAGTHVYHQLTQAALVTGLSSGEIAKTLSNALTDGAKQPRNKAPQSAVDAFRSAPPLPPGLLLASSSLAGATPQRGEKGGVPADSVVAEIIGRDLSDYAICEDEDNAVYRWDDEQRVWAPKTGKRVLHGLVYKALSQRYREFTNNKVNGVTGLLPYTLAVMPGTATSKMILYFTNGTWSPLTGQFTPCDVKPLMPRNNVGVEFYSTDGKRDAAPAFAEYVDYICGVGDPEQAPNRAEQRRDVLYAALAMVMLRGWNWQLFIEICGKGGTGKSTAYQLFETLVGKTSVFSAEAEQLESPERRSDMVNAALIYLADQREYQGEAAGLKKITGGDPVSCRRLYGSAYSAHIKAVIIATNNEPMKFRDAGGAIERRRVVIKLDRKVTNPDETLVRKLRDEVPAIAQFLQCWITEQGGPAGVKHLLRESVKSDDVTEVMNDTDPMADFASQLCYGNDFRIQIGGATAHGPLTKLYPAYLRYCAYHGISRPVSQRNFKKQFMQAAKRYGGCREIKPCNKVTLVGVGLPTGNETPEWLGIFPAVA